MNRHINLFKERLKIALKEVSEYKANLYSLLMFNIIVIGKYLITLAVMKNLIGEKFTWNQVDFLVFAILIILAGVTNYSFSLKNFHRKINNGDLNQGLSKPINQFLFQVQNNIGGYDILNNLIFIVILITISIYFNYFNLIGIVFLSFGIIYYILVTNFVESFSFFSKNNFVADLMKKTDRYNRTFTPKTFEGANFESLFLLLPTAVYGYLTIEINKGNFTKLIEYQNIYLVSIVILIIGTYILWKFGLKKYEGYN